jgi:hypothetical protein
MTLRVTLAAALAAASLQPSLALAFEKTGVGWCDTMLSRYERCLRNVTLDQCATIARRYHLSATYQQPGPAGEARGPRTYSSPAHACLAEVQDLIGEMRLNVQVVDRLTSGSGREQACRSLQSIVSNNSKFYCGH